MFGSAFILHRLQRGLFWLCSVGCLVLRSDIHSLVPLSKLSQLPERIQDVCRYQKHARRCSYFVIVLGKPLSRKLHSEESVFPRLSLPLGQGSHHAIHVIEHVIVHCDDVMLCECMPRQHPNGSILKWLQYFHDRLDSRPFILSCD
jgi:hypothetical protein